jgi:hypothetical protein
VGIPVVVTVLSGLGLAALVLRMVRRMTGGGEWTDAHRLALAGGALGLFALLAPLQELDASRVDNTAGMSLVGLAAAVFLVWLWRRTARRIPVA